MMIMAFRIWVAGIFIGTSKILVRTRRGISPGPGNVAQKKGPPKRAFRRKAPENQRCPEGSFGDSTQVSAGGRARETEPRSLAVAADDVNWGTSRSNSTEKTSGR